MKTFFVQPLISEKSLANAAEGRYTFVVPMWANKRQIAEHVAAHFNVTVANVSTASVAPRLVRFRSRLGEQARFKKAVVTLKSGQSIEAFSFPVEASQNEVQPQAPEAEPVTESKITVRSKKRASKEDKE